MNEWIPLCMNEIYLLLYAYVCFFSLSSSAHSHISLIESLTMFRTISVWFLCVRKSKKKNCMNEWLNEFGMGKITQPIYGNCVNLTPSNAFDTNDCTKQPMKETSKNYLKQYWYRFIFCVLFWFCLWFWSVYDNPWWPSVMNFAFFSMYLQWIVVNFFEILIKIRQKFTIALAICLWKESVN